MNRNDKYRGLRFEQRVARYGRIVSPESLLRRLRATPDIIKALEAWMQQLGPDARMEITVNDGKGREEMMEICEPELSRDKLRQFNGEEEMPWEDSSNSNDEEFDL